jgi:pimeloyl-ACP methyl ester carboxylesterase
MGGYIALRAFELSPEIFAGLILCDTNCVADSNEAKVKRFNSIEQLQAGNKADFIEGFVKNVFSENTLANSVTTVHYLKNLISQTSNDTICATQLALAARTETSSVLPGIQIPTLIIRGASDKLMSEEQTLQLHKGILNSELVHISGSGHLPNLENATEFNRALTDFLHKHFLA